MEREFFFDTANLTELDEIVNWLGHDISHRSIGITTNPNAISKVGTHTLCDLKKHLAKLTTWSVKNCRFNCSVYIQYPNSNMSIDQLSWFINEIQAVSPHIGFKIAPRPSLIAAATEISDNINVTGIADAGTAVMCLSNPNLRFASIIPGRMEEAGVDANSHLDYIRSVNDISNFSPNRLITGSMRNLTGLQKAISYGSVPTIGYKVWKLLMEQSTPTDFLKMWDNTIPFGDKMLCPLVTEVNHKLSTDFFKQMDDVSVELRKDLERSFY